MDGHGSIYKYLEADFQDEKMNTCYETWLHCSANDYLVLFKQSIYPTIGSTLDDHNIWYCFQEPQIT